jgi:hypothetical protein
VVLHAIRLGWHVVFLLLESISLACYPSFMARPAIAHPPEQVCGACATLLVQFVPRWVRLVFVLLSVSTNVSVQMYRQRLQHAEPLRPL